MKQRNNIALFNKDEANILYSLQYLTHEAKESGSEPLHSILNTALRLAQTNDEVERTLLSKSANDEDIKKAGYFLFQFLSASDEVRAQVLDQILSE
ncbi:hypothetical protein [Marinoscillum sp.]|uniref:hypothetical protein n=1 Tax=Marinoscillum sp. TaxID=2024838 RepID=UPI003BAB1C7F